MIITVLIIPLSLPTIFFTLFYSLTQCRWLMSVTHLSALNHWQDFSLNIYMILLVILVIIGLLATMLTGLLVMILNKKSLPEELYS